MTCEGLAGEVDARVFLDGTVASWRARSARDGVTAAPGVVWSPAAAEAVARLSEPATGVPSLTTGGPVAAWLGEPPGLDWRGGGARVAIDPKERAIPGFELPSGPVAVADAWVFPATHWVQLLWANLLALGPFLWGELASPGRLAWGVLRSGSIRPEDVAARVNRLGAGARVHRSAVVEGCVLGRGARVGAGAVVRGAVLGDDAIVEELALVEGCVLGRGARVQRMGFAKFSVLEDGAAHAGAMQLGVLGRGAQVKHGAALMDMAFGQSARVMAAGSLRPAPHGLCGVCVGDGAVVAQGVRIAPGRAVPPGVEIHADPDQIVRFVDLPPGTARAVARGGRLEPF
ncbi:MAG: hypothetical protein ACOZNI_09455 [Myxococcota bacterium]